MVFRLVLIISCDHWLERLRNQIDISLTSLRILRSHHHSSAQCDKEIFPRHQTPLTRFRGSNFEPWIQKSPWWWLTPVLVLRIILYFETCIQSIDIYLTLLLLQYLTLLWNPTYYLGLGCAILLLYFETSINIVQINNWPHPATYQLLYCLSQYTTYNR